MSEAPSAAVRSPFGADGRVLSTQSLVTDALTRTYTGPYANSGWGTPAEQTMAFALGERGYDILIGPGGAAGKDPNANGWDAVAVHRATGELLIVDNKASGLPGLVEEATSITTRWTQNLDYAIRAIADLSDEVPDKAAALDKLRELQEAGKTGAAMPEGVRVAISNAGGFVGVVGGDGQVTLVGEKLQAAFESGSGIKGRVDSENMVPPNMIKERQAWVEAETAAGRKPVSAFSGTTMEVTLPRATPMDVMGPITELAEAKGTAAIVVIEAIKRALVLYFSLTHHPTQMDADLAALAPRIQAALRRNPNGGVLLLYVWSQLPGTPPLVGVVDDDEAYNRGYSHLAISEGATPDDAYRRYLDPRLSISTAGDPSFLAYRALWIDTTGVRPYSIPTTVPPAPADGS